MRYGTSYLQFICHNKMRPIGVYCAPLVQELEGCLGCIQKHKSLSKYVEIRDASCYSKVVSNQCGYTNQTKGIKETSWIPTELFGPFLCTQPELFRRQITHITKNWKRFRTRGVGDGKTWTRLADMFVIEDIDNRDKEQCTEMHRHGRSRSVREEMDQKGKGVREHTVCFIHATGNKLNPSVSSYPMRFTNCG